VEAPSEDVDRFFFCHLQKTAGTTLFLWLREYFDDAAVYPNDDDGPKIPSVISIDHLLDRWHRRRDEIRVVTGHFPLCTTELLGGGFRTFTILREPIARTHSYLRHHRATNPEGDRRHFEAIYDDPLRFHGLIHNHMVKMFSLTTDEMTEGALTRVDFTRQHLERAKENLASIEVVGLQEDFGAFWTDLTGTFGWDLGPPGFANRSDPAGMPEALTERIIEDNALDIELYQFAQALVAGRRC
jgi:hypothetical protein